MSEKIDPYFGQRLETGRGHQVLRSIEIDNGPAPEVEPNKELANPTLEGAIEEFGWSEKSVDNIIDALENGKIKIEFLESGRMRIELCPIKELPEQLGHVSELDTIKQNLKPGVIFGSSQPDQFTYLQTVDFAVEGYIDDESDGKEYGRVYVDSPKLSSKRNVYLDPESLHITDYEYGYSYCVKGGVPFESIAKIDIIKAKKLEREVRDIETGNWPEDVEQHTKDQVERLRGYLQAKVNNKFE